MTSLRKKRWVAAAALGAMLAGQTAPLYAYGSVGASSDAKTPDRSEAIWRKDGNADRSNDTRTPIKHVMLIIGENRTFDHVFGTFQANPGQTVFNLLSEGIVNADGSPGPNFAKSEQWQAENKGAYTNNPTKTAPFSALPPENTDGAPTAAPFSSVSDAEAVDPALPKSAYNLLTTGGTGLPQGAVDTRIFATLPDGPFDLTDPAISTITYDDYAGSPVHRFFQMWQQVDCNINAATPGNPSGCLNDLFPWVEVTIGAGSNGKPQPAGFNDESTHEGSISMGFYNSARGDVSYFTQLAHEYTLSDNDHQAIMGGTGANHIAIAYGAEIYFADVSGKPATPPSNQIENPDAQAGTNNYYMQDGYSGGSYVNCADSTQPGVAPIMKYLNSLPYKLFRNGDCAKNAYYLVNNYNPGFNGLGVPDYNPAPNDFTVPPSRQNNIGIELTKHHISWRYYGEGWDNGKEDGEQSSAGGGYCNICNPFQYSTQIMTNPTLRQEHLAGIRQLYTDINNGTLPAVTIVKPDGFLDGHPASSKFDLFEQFCHNIIDMIQANPQLWKSTAIVITVDEGGGYYDSGYIQPLDFFGDGTRIPLIVVSPYSEGGRVVHTYYDHVSFVKFVEANWGLKPISKRSRDNLPNPIARKNNPYVPLNGPAIGDLMDMFSFDKAAENDD